MVGPEQTAKEEACQKSGDLVVFQEHLGIIHLCKTKLGGETKGCGYQKESSR